MSRVLVVEDEVDLCELIARHLESEGHTVDRAYDGLAALRVAETATPDLVILDWMMPGLDGLSVARRLRLKHLMPIVMLTARGDEADRILGLEVGADDYVVKPFSVRELMARVRAMLRRVEFDHSTDAASGGEIVRGPLQLDTDARTAHVNGAAVDLTRREYDILALLAGNSGRAFSRAYIVDRLWGEAYDGYERNVDTHVKRLRHKLGDAGAAIDTVWGIGYRFSIDAEKTAKASAND